MLRTLRMTRDDVTKIVKKTTLALTTGLGVAALIVAVAAAPAEARKKSRSSKPFEAALPDPTNGEPMTLVISLSQQKVDVYRGTTRITSSRVSTGMRGYATKAGVFSILEKRRRHHSNLYSGAPMPWMQRLTWSGTALHGGVVPGYPASHGCVRLPFSFAPRLFGITTVGEHVVVARAAVTPQPIEHANLFNPLTPAAPSVVKQEAEPKRESSNTVAPPRPAASSLLVVLARADVGGVASDVTPTIGGPAPSEDDTDHAATEPAKQPAAGDAPPVEDTRSHAIDPFAPSAKPSTDHAIMTPEDGVVTDHAETEQEPSEAPKAQAESKPAPEPASIAASPEPAQLIGTSQSAAAEPAPAKAETPAAPAASDKPVPAEAKTEEAKPVEAKAVEAAPAPAASPEAKPAETTAAEGTPAATGPATPTTDSASPEKTASSETAPTDAAKAQEAASAAPAPAAVPEVAAATPEAAKVIPAVAVVPAAAKEPALTDTPPSLAALTLGAGAKAAAVEAAEPRSTAPLRILVTRRTKTDRIIGVQNILSELGHLEAQKFDGTLGRSTVVAIKAFQKANGLPETGALTDELAKKVYEVGGKGEPPAGHLFVRQEFGRVFDAPVSFKDPEKPLGTHLFTALKFAPGDTKARWIAISLQGDDPAEALNRLEIPEDVRRNISERLTPGSSLIVGDVAINSANLPKGADFLVWAKDMPAKITAASYEPEAAPRPRKKKRVARAPRRQQDFTFRYAPAPRAYSPRTFNSGYPRWPF